MDLIRPAKVAQWGGSAAVRISTAALERAQMQLNDPVYVIAREGEIIIRRQRPKVSMSELLARFEPDKHRHTLAFEAPE